MTVSFDGVTGEVVVGAASIETKVWGSADPTLASWQKIGYTKSGVEVVDRSTLSPVNNFARVDARAYQLRGREQSIRFNVAQSTLANFYRAFAEGHADLTNSVLEIGRSDFDDTLTRMGVRIIGPSATPGTDLEIVAPACVPSGIRFAHRQAEARFLPIVLKVARPYRNETLILDGGFATGTPWTTGAGWTISGGKATVNHATPGNLTQPLTETFRHVSLTVQYEIVDYTAGTVKAGITAVGGGSPVWGLSYSGVGWVEEEIDVPSNASLTLSFDASAGTNLAIDNVAVFPSSTIFMKEV